MIMVTIFTPSYNRAHTLRRLYDSLCNQSCKDFEWIVVDDGSTDGTEKLVSGFKEFQVSGAIPFEIRYFKQANGGKHRAINRGVQEARGELFFIVDSDDYLTSDAIDWVVATYPQIKGNDAFAGFSGLRIHPDGTKIGGGEDFGVVDIDAIQFRNKLHIPGDMAEIYRTEVLRMYPFPDIPGEKFCSEGVIWGRIAKKYKLRYFFKGIYVCEYLDGGLSATRYVCRVNSPDYSMLLYSEMLDHPNSMIGHIKYILNFWRFGTKSKKPFLEKCKQIGFPGCLLAPIGWIMSKFL